MEINYEQVLPLVLRAMFPKPAERAEVEEKLKKYGRESWQPVPDRIRLAILKLVYDNPNHPGLLESLVETACGDYRDVIYFAETPLSFEDWDLPNADPQKYDELLQQDKHNYFHWINKMTCASL
ncbi:hypothetical protein Q5H93_13415 [Hymenobacter sp. ASUV-10]|uniref:DUF5071 domain-containing protein n=1 Tax=Hymenobacter aranciens TaxID=3063996 RepID=A0ABT9BBV2_9BACT|nr:hypothetical protein [Hymenobacter sp. ASUV-10]MDO7875737.1 hypothetical protein [Hymenobacter sp. ASUV-10]